MIPFECRRHKPDYTPVIRDADIEAQVEAMLADYKPALLREPQPISPEHFAEAYMGLNVEYHRIGVPEAGIVGAMVFNDDVIPVMDDGRLHNIPIRANTIVIHEDINTERYRGFWRFTLLHECGHAWMHGRVYRRNEAQLTLFEDSCTFPHSVRCYRSTLLDARKQLETNEDFREHQANVMASETAMPRASFLPLAQGLLKEQGFGEVVSQWEIEHNTAAECRYDSVLKRLADRYGTSVAAVKVKMSKLGFLDSDAALFL